MNKKQLKRIAKEMADLEFLIQNSADYVVVEGAKREMLKKQESMELELEDMLALDDMVKKYLEQKNI